MRLAGPERVGPAQALCALALAALASLSNACGAAAPTPSPYPMLPTPRGPRRILEMTDLEDVRDVARSGSAVYVATDAGLLVFEGEGNPSRFGRREGLPDDDVTAVAVDAQGRVMVAVDRALWRFEAGRFSPESDAPPLARITDLAFGADGTLWVCSLSGLARRPPSGGWEVFGERFPCTTLAPTPEGALWAGSARGLYYVEGDVVREHPISGGIPEGYVRSLAPVRPGQVLALLSGPSRGVIGLFDGTSWHAYSLPEVDERVAGLATVDGTTLVLVTERRAYSIAPAGDGRPLRALSSVEAQLRSFRAETLPASRAPAPEPIEAAQVLRGMQPLRNDAAAASASRAPPLVARPWMTTAFPGGAYRVFQVGEAAFAAIANRGIVALSSRSPRPYRSMTLVSDEDLQVATDLSSGVWVRGRDGDVAKWVDGRLRRLALPDEIVPQALASGPEGAYLVALVRGSSTVRVFVAQGSGFRALVERRLDVPGGVAAIPFAGVGSDGRIWLALRVGRDEGGTRMRGAAVIDPRSERVVYHHRDAPQGQGLPLDDEVSAMTFDAQGNAWFATLTGAVRVEEHQAIRFDGTRGVQGDVVTDLVAGSGNMWVASAEGLGSYADRRFDYGMPPVVREHRPVALAVDARGTLWAAGRRGLLSFDGAQWTAYDVAGIDADGRPRPGLPTREFRDVETDGTGRVWLLSAEAVVVIE